MGSCSYESHSNMLDVRVFYVRIITNLLLVEDNNNNSSSFPESLTLTHTPLSPETSNIIIELINSRRSPAARNCSEEGLSCILRRDRVGKKSEQEVTFVSTDIIRLNGSTKFDVFDGDELLISGVLEMSCNASKRWSMSCEFSGSGFFKGKKRTMMMSESFLPAVEVYVAGCFSGFPIVLTRTLQVANGSYKQEEEEEEYENELYWRRRRDYVEGEDGELSWFNAGVRVGVGIGLGICVGIGIGVGLLVRTYQTTTGTFQRRLV